MGDYRFEKIQLDIFSNNPIIPPIINLKPLSPQNPMQKMRLWFRKNVFTLLQFIASLFFLYYSFTETNRFYIVLTGRKGLFYLAEDVAKLLRAAHLETMLTKQEQGFLQYIRQLVVLGWQKGLQKIHQHFIHSTAIFAQKAVQKYSANLVEICAPNWSGGGGWEKGGWYGYMESTIRIFTRPTEMGYCFLDSNRIFNSFLNMETEKYFLQCKINLVSIGTTVCLGVPMFYRAVNHFILEYRPPVLLVVSSPLSSQRVVEEIVDISGRRSQRQRNSMK